MRLKDDEHAVKSGDMAVAGSVEVPQSRSDSLILMERVTQRFSMWVISVGNVQSKTRNNLSKF